MRSVLLVVAVVMGIGGWTKGDEKAEKLKKLEATVKKARKLANEEIEGEERQTETRLAAIKKLDLMLGLDIEIGMKRASLPIPSVVKKGATIGELMMGLGMTKKVTKESLFYYDDDDFLSVLADHNPNVTAERFVELARLWAICEGTASIVASRKFGTEVRKDDEPAQRLMNAIRGK